MPDNVRGLHRQPRPDSSAVRIVELLRDRSDQAFTVTELSERLGLGKRRTRLVVKALVRAGYLEASSDVGLSGEWQGGVRLGVKWHITQFGCDSPLPVLVVDNERGRLLGVRTAADPNDDGGNQYIRETYERSGMSVRGLARLIGISERQLRRIITNDITIPSDDSLLTRVDKVPLQPALY
jgi:DNA-binding Lrp family transcriptional regulator